jgi:hypothetical protein
MAPTPKCSIPGCGEVASWIRADTQLLCQSHNDLDPSRLDMPREGVWEHLRRFGEDPTEEQLERSAEERGLYERASEHRERIDDRPKPTGVGREEFESWLLTKIGQGWPQGLILKQAIIAINMLGQDRDRWVEAEFGRSRSSPVWLAEEEAKALVRALEPTSSTTIRLLVETLKERFHS